MTERKKSEFVASAVMLYNLKTQNMNNLMKLYREEIAPRLAKELGLNKMAVPVIKKITVNVGAKEGVSDKKVIEKIVEQITVITGQKPVVKKAKMAIAGFKLKENDPIGVMVTLRGVRMYDFMEKLFKIVLPRVRDFRGVPVKSFDGQGNYSLGLSEQIVFSEIEYDKIDKIRGLQVNFSITGGNDSNSRKLLELLGLPFFKG